MKNNTTERRKQKVIEFKTSILVDEHLKKINESNENVHEIIQSKNMNEKLNKINQRNNHPTEDHPFLLTGRIFKPSSSNFSDSK